MFCHHFLSVALSVQTLFLMWNTDKWLSGHTIKVSGLFLSLFGGGGMVFQYWKWENDDNILIFARNIPSIPVRLDTDQSR